MYTGVGQMDKLGSIRKLNNRSVSKIWRNNMDGDLSVCNMINGTDTTIFPPRIPTDSLYIYSTDICRYFEFDIGCVCVCDFKKIRIDCFFFSGR